MEIFEQIKAVIRQYKLSYSQKLSSSKKLSSSNSTCHALTEALKATSNFQISFKPPPKQQSSRTTDLNSNKDTKYTYKKVSNKNEVKNTFFMKTIQVSH